MSGDMAQVVERLDDYIEIPGTIPLYTTIFLPTTVAWWYTSLQVETHN